MLTKIFTASTLGLQAQLIEVEIDLSQSLPGIVVVGLPDKAVQESKERIRASLKQSGFEFPVGKITVNLAPADITKTGTGFDLAIAVGILQLTGILPNFEAKTLFVGELALDGRIRSVTGLLTVCLWARENGYKQIFLPFDNECEVSLVRGLDIFAAKSLAQIVKHLQNLESISVVEPIDLKQHFQKLANFPKAFLKPENSTNSQNNPKLSNPTENLNSKNLSHQNLNTDFESKNTNSTNFSNKITKLQFLLDQFSQKNLAKILK